MYIRRILPKAIQNLVTRTTSRNVAADSAKNKLSEVNPQKTGRQFSFLTKNKLTEVDKTKNIVQTVIRKSSGGGELQIRGAIPGIGFMMQSPFKCTLVFTLYFLVAWWAPVILFCIIWAKQQGFK